MKNSLLLKLTLLAGMVVLVILLRLHCADEPLERDITTYAYIAHNLLNGEHLYTELWDHKPPGIYLVFALGQAVFGYNQFTITALGIIFTLISGAFLYFFLYRITNSTTALLGATFWTFASNSVTLQANQPNVELFMNSFTFIALWALARLDEKKQQYVFVAGIFFAFVSFLKMIAIFPMLFICFYFILPIIDQAQMKWISQRLRSIFMFLVPSVLLWSATFIYFKMSGHFSEFWEAVFAYNSYYSQNVFKNITDFFISPNRLFNNSLTEIWILVLLSIAWFSISQKRYASLKRSFFIFFLLGTCFAVASPGYDYPHYYQLLLPPVCILAALFFHDAFRTVRERNLPYGKAVLIGLVISAISLTGIHQIQLLRMSSKEISMKKYGTLFTQSYEVAKIVAKNTAEGDEIFVWGAETGIYFYSKRKSVSGIAYIYPLFVGPPKERLNKIRRVITDVSASPPEVFVFNEAYGKIESNYFYPFIKDRYKLVEKIDNYLIFKSNQTAHKRAETLSGPQINKMIISG